MTATTIRFSGSWFVGAAAAVTFFVLLARNVISPTYRAVRKVLQRQRDLLDMVNDTRTELGLEEWAPRRRRSDRRRPERLEDSDWPDER